MPTALPVAEYILHILFYIQNPESWILLIGKNRHFRIKLKAAYSHYTDVICENRNQNKKEDERDLLVEQGYKRPASSQKVEVGISGKNNQLH